MTDMHREAFVRWAQATMKHDWKWRESSPPSSNAIRIAEAAWQAAIRHLTEQNEQRDSHE